MSVGVIGAGAWGTALAQMLASDGRDVLISKDRARGARVIAERGVHDVILMDDGMQNPYLVHDLTIGVFDGATGIGNGWLMPAGPLRTPLAEGLARLDLAIINGTDETGLGALAGRPDSSKASRPPAAGSRVACHSPTITPIRSRI